MNKLSKMELPKMLLYIAGGVVMLFLINIVGLGWAFIIMFVLILSYIFWRNWIQQLKQKKEQPPRILKPFKWLPR